MTVQGFQSTNEGIITPSGKLIKNNPIQSEQPTRETTPARVTQGFQTTVEGIKTPTGNIVQPKKEPARVTQAPGYLYTDPNYKHQKFVESLYKQRLAGVSQEEAQKKFKEYKESNDLGLKETYELGLRAQKFIGVSESQLKESALRKAYTIDLEELGGSKKALSDLTEQGTYRSYINDALISGVDVGDILSGVEERYARDTMTPLERIKTVVKDTVESGATTILNRKERKKERKENLNQGIEQIKNSELPEEEKEREIRRLKNQTRIENLYDITGTSARLASNALIDLPLNLGIETVDYALDETKFKKQLREDVAFEVSKKLMEEYQSLDNTVIGAGVKNILEDEQAMNILSLLDFVPAKKAANVSARQSRKLAETAQKAQKKTVEYLATRVVDGQPSFLKAVPSELAEKAGESMKILGETKVGKTVQPVITKVKKAKDWVQTGFANWKITGKYVKDPRFKKDPLGYVANELADDALFPARGADSANTAVIRNKLTKTYSDTPNIDLGNSGKVSEKARIEQFKIDVKETIADILADKSAGTLGDNLGVMLTNVKNKGVYSLDGLSTRAKELADVYEYQFSAIANDVIQTVALNVNDINKGVRLTPEEAFKRLSDEVLDTVGGRVPLEGKIPENRSLLQRMLNEANIRTTDDLFDVKNPEDLRRRITANDPDNILNTTKSLPAEFADNFDTFQNFKNEMGTLIKTRAKELSPSGAAKINVIPQVTADVLQQSWDSYKSRIRVARMFQSLHVTTKAKMLPIMRAVISGGITAAALSGGSGFVDSFARAFFIRNEAQFISDQITASFVNPRYKTAEKARDLMTLQSMGEAVVKSGQMTKNQVQSKIDEILSGVERSIDKSTNQWNIRDAVKEALEQDSIIKQQDILYRQAQMRTQDASMINDPKIEEALKKTSRQFENQTSEALKKHSSFLEDIDNQLDTIMAELDKKDLTFAKVGNTIKIVDKAELQGFKDLVRRSRNNIEDFMEARGKDFEELKDIVKRPDSEVDVDLEDIDLGDELEDILYEYGDTDVQIEPLEVDAEPPSDLPIIR